jgi:transcriptional regulator with XRE-family HTH domain
MDPSTLFRNNLRKLRVAIGLTQEALAYDVGTSSSYVSAIERGKSSPTLAVMERLAKALGVKLVYLITDKILISILSAELVEIGPTPTHPAVQLRRQPIKATGRRPANG